MNYSVTFCNVDFAETLVEINSIDWTIRAVKCKDVLEFFCKTKSPFVLCIICAVSLTRIVRESNHDADIFNGKRCIQFVNFMTELVPQKVNKKK